MDEQNPRIEDLEGAAEDSAPSVMEPPPQERTREIQAEIEQTREEMSETVNAIQERLRPSTIASNAVESVKHAAVDTARDVAQSDPVTYMRSNPIPTAMVGIGIAGLVWLAMGGHNGRSFDRSYIPRKSNSSGRIQRSAPRDGANGFSDAPREYSRRDTTPAYPSVLAGVTGDSDSGAADSERYGAMQPHVDYEDRRSQTWPREERSADSGFVRHVQNPLLRTWNESPLLMGAASAVLGAIVGFAIPETEREHQLIGGPLDSVIDTVQETVREKVDQVQEATTNAVHTVQDAAKDAVGLPTSEHPNAQNS